MASSPNVYIEAGYIEDGYYELLAVVPPTTPVSLLLGTPGHATHALPFRALGGSVVDLDLLYGLLGHQSAMEDIQPIFALGLRATSIRAFGYEIPRQAILDAVIEAYATLLEVEDITIEGNPAGDNLFGYVGLTTRPISSVRLSNVDRFWNRLVERELILNAPAGLFADISHQVVLPALTGTITGYVFEGSSILLSYGFAGRRFAPSD